MHKLLHNINRKQHKFDVPPDACMPVTTQMQMRVVTNLHFIRTYTQVKKKEEKKRRKKRGTCTCDDHYQQSGHNLDQAFARPPGLILLTMETLQVLLTTQPDIVTYTRTHTIMLLEHVFTPSTISAKLVPVAESEARVRMATSCNNRIQ